MKTVLLTGCAGFIGFHVGSRLLESGHRVIGIDNLNQYYNEGLKNSRLALLLDRSAFRFQQMDITDRSKVEKLFRENEFGPIIHLAAQAGVRYSLENPYLYIDSNVTGFVNLIEEARKKRVPHFIYASSSSVYGANKKTPFSETDYVDHPVSLYAATKKSNELIAHVYAHLYGLPVTGLRFFTVYGPWGRPDMALFKFCKAIWAGTPIDVYNNGNMLRDFTYIDDIVQGVVRILEEVPGWGQPDAASDDSSALYRLYNIGNNHPVKLTRLIEILETEIGRKAQINWLPMQPGDVPTTYADISRLAGVVGYRPGTSIEVGVGRFVTWYREYYKL